MLSAAEIMEIAGALGTRVHDLLRPSSPVYKERKEELLAMDEQNLAQVISTEPTLIKRPIIKTGKGYVVGLNEEKIRELL
jgi:arsenate reductase-like glutaredoxin family protein